MGLFTKPPSNIPVLEGGDGKQFTETWKRFFFSLWTAINTLGGTSGGAANPTAKVGPAAVNGTAVTFMRSDAAPPIDLTLAYTWTGIHTYQKAVILQAVTVTYSPSITIDASLGNEFVITANDGVAFAINAPTNPATGQLLEITIRNTSGGALGAATWNAAFKMSAWTNPANGNSRTILFRYNGTNWVQRLQSAVDVPN